MNDAAPEPRQERHKALLAFALDNLVWLILLVALSAFAILIPKFFQIGILLNIIVGIVGALLAGFLLAPLFGTGTINANDFSLPSLLVSLLGAVVLLAIVNLFRRGTVR